MNKYLVTWVDQFWSKDKECIKLLEEQRRTRVVDNFEPTQNGIKKFEESQKVEDKGNGLYWTALVLSFSKLEE